MFAKGFTLVVTMFVIGLTAMLTIAIQTKVFLTSKANHLLIEHIKVTHHTESLIVRANDFLRTQLQYQTLEQLITNKEIYSHIDLSAHCSRYLPTSSGLYHVLTGRQWQLNNSIADSNGQGRFIIEYLGQSKINSKDALHNFRITAKREVIQEANHFAQGFFQYCLNEQSCVNPPQEVNRLVSYVY